MNQIKRTQKGMTMTVLKENNITRCKICGELKARIHDGNFANKKDKRYIGDCGKQWSGLTCPGCHTLLTKERTRRKRSGND